MGQKAAMAGVALIALAASPAHGGFRFAAEGGEQSLVSKGRIKQAAHTAEQPQSVLDVGTGRMWMSNPTKKVYWEGTVEEFCGQMKQAVSSMQDAMRKRMEEQMARMPPEQRAKMEAMMQSFGGASSASAPPPPAPRVKIEQTDKTETIAGQPTRQYRALVDGQLKDDYWVTTDPAIAHEFALDKAAATMGKFRSCQSIHSSAGADAEAMNQVLLKGFPLKTVSYVDGRASTTQLYTKVEQAEIPESEFLPPTGFTKATLQDAMFGGPRAFAPPKAGEEHPDGERGDDADEEE